MVVNWNGKHHLGECLGSLMRLNYDNYVILFVDNNSTDGSVECAEQDFPECEFIQNSTNLGCGGGRNVGLKWALARDFDYIGFLDNDTVADTDYLTHLVAYMEQNAAVGAAGARFNYYGAPDRVQFMGGTINHYLWRTTLNGQGMREEDAVRLGPQFVDFVGGGTCIARRSAIEKVGFFDESLWRGEDIDWCLRLRKLGYELVCVPLAVVWHKQSRVTGKHGFSWWAFRNSWVYFYRYASVKHWLTAPLAFAIQVSKLVLRPLWEWYIGRKIGVSIGGPDGGQHARL